MDVIYGLIPSMIIIGIILVVILFWAIKSGQFDDLEGDASRILMDEDLTPEKQSVQEKKVSDSVLENKTEENNQDKADKSEKNS
ncbi:MAG: cbb3-type cytochrome oxidase assembly protein CcoS [gamma proteobacterium symbiont of Bathyaustriella thionipta]|nr:cbb3-type cytochrome oxidase assembly protein CcoS [gamma proteobacterium symbiont of Bathyaustriella thionipta]MCU7949148.1 cbb3-type cytochrome oxidase assembly protein CcoS [gamma proteobacterium symbiont of Bathyaustriella thionipta]MCU7952234.1 cbb3-type cytochrome oxidase assembly protein CcoS [gamma proteobacterium symbiont of Bathyaustriella thionipta]MCU7955783.1 cbb3-type cytochrome oxidase assembly protein CcoS [gamma proteobacterium symbiont of Bathyaustriella thionipta]MCU796560